jgi:hypothetical protein
MTMILAALLIGLAAAQIDYVDNFDFGKYPKVNAGLVLSLSQQSYGDFSKEFIG